MMKSYYNIINFWILDSSLNIYIYNNSYRFKPTHTTILEDYLMSGFITYQIKIYSTINITIITPNKSKRNTTLYNIILVPSFFTNLILFSRIIGVGIY